MRSLHEIPLKADATKKFNIEWELAIPNVTFIFNENKDDKMTTFTSKLDYNCLFEKFGLKKGENEATNVNTLANTIVKCFTDNRVTIEPWQVKYYAVEFKGDEDKTLFKVYLKND